MRIKSLRLERYHCARRWLRKKKRNWERNRWFTRSKLIVLAQVVQKLDSAIHRINLYPVDTYYGKQLRYPLDSAIQRLNNRGQVCFRTTIGLCGFNLIAPPDLVSIEFRVRSLSSSAFMFAPKPDPVRLESNASAWNSYDMQLQYFNINSQRFNSRLGSWQAASRLFSLLKYHCFSQSSYFLGKHPKHCKF